MRFLDDSRRKEEEETSFLHLSKEFLPRVYRDFNKDFNRAILLMEITIRKTVRILLNFIYRFIRYSNWNPITISSSIPSYISSKSYGQLTILHIEINRKEKKDNIKNFVRNKSKISLTIQKWNWLILWLNTLHARINKRAWKNKIDDSFVRPIKN